MKNILITGASGNIGNEVIRYLFKINTENRIIAGVRNIEKTRQMFQAYPKLEYVYFDFEDLSSFVALKNIDCVFLLRPPHISDVNKYFKPLIEKIKENGIDQIVFLSVQGVENSKIIPHHKIEKLILENRIPYVFLRPSYFMQNLTTTLREDIKKNKNIVLPSGKAKFNWIDVENIGEIAAILLDNFSKYRNQAFELTGYENKDFYEVAEIVTEAINKKVVFSSVNPFSFYYIKKKEGLAKGMILVMIMLHFLPRFQKEPNISGFYEKLTGKKPTTLKEFIVREKLKFK